MRFEQPIPIHFPNQPHLILLILGLSFRTNVRNLRMIVEISPFGRNDRRDCHSKCGRKSDPFLDSHKKSTHFCEEPFLMGGNLQAGKITRLFIHDAAGFRQGRVFLFFRQQGFDFRIVLLRHLR